MTNRVALGILPGGGVGLRVSRPGYDVLSTGLQEKQVAFDSRWGRAERVFATGTVTLGVQPAFTYHSISFGVTFASVPTVLFLWRDSGSTQWQNPLGLSGSWTSGGGTGFELCYAFTSQVQFAHPFTGSSLVYSYLILRP